VKFRKVRYLAIAIILLGIVSVLIGAGFVGMAMQKNNYLVNALRAQKVTLGLSQDQIAKGEVIHNAAEAQVAAQTLSKHLQSIAGGTYSDLMAANKTGKYDPTDPKDLDYTQGLNMENSFNLVVLGFGVIQETMAVGGALIVMGIAIGSGGLLLFRLVRQEV
jgi:hypothetical protein